MADRRRAHRARDRAAPRVRAVALGLIGLAYASQSVVRLVPFFVVLAALWTGPDIRLPRRLPRIGLLRDLLPALAAGIPALLILGPPAGCRRGVGARSRRGIRAQRPRGAPRPAVHVGAVCQLALAPGLQVSLDGRRETVYSDALVRRQLPLAEGDRDALDWLMEADPDYAWYPTRFAAVRDRLDAEGYRIDVETGQPFIAVRADRAPLATGAPHHGCLPWLGPPASPPASR